MKALAILARKGGAGKTTLAVHMAVAAVQTGKRVLLVDTDPQHSAGDWWRSRAADSPELVECDVAQLQAVLTAAGQAGVDLVIIDTRPSVEADTAAVARQADLTLIPTRPSILDLRAIAGTVQVIHALHRPAAIVLNATPPPRGDTEAAVTAEARIALEAYGLPVAPVSLGNRAVLQHALVGGLAVSEFEPDSKAAAELGTIYSYVKDILWPNEPQ
jgi:chromosome partitioning protein